MVAQLKSATLRAKITFGVLMALCCAVAVFYLPFHLRLLAINASASGDYGFDNAVAIAAILLLVLFGTILYYLLFSSDTARQASFFTTVSHQVQNLPRNHLLFVFSVYLLVILAIYMLTAGEIRYGESVYLLDRLDRLRMGQTPYVDFEFNYGPLFLYVPYYFFQAFRFLGVTLEQSYFVIFTMSAFVGLLFLYYVVNRLNLSRQQKVFVFYAISLSALPISLGFSYTFLRFVTPFIGLVVMDRAMSSLAVKTGTKRRLAAITVLTLLLILANFALSPEIGMAFTVTLLAYFLFSSVFRERRAALVILFSIIAIVLAIVVVPQGFFLSTKSFGGGGSNWPIIPSPSVILYLAGLFFTAITLLTQNLKYKQDALLFGVIVLNLSLIPGAMGRSDPGHVFFYGIGVFLLSFVYAANRSNLAFKVYGLCFVLVFTLGLTLTGLYFYRGVVRSIVVTRIETQYSEQQLLDIASRIGNVLPSGSGSIVERIQHHYLSRTVIEPAEPGTVLGKYAKVGMPFGNDDTLYPYLRDTGKYVPAYYMFANITSEAQISRIISDLMSDDNKVILVPEARLGNAALASGSSDEEENRYLSVLFLYPYNLHKIRNTRELYTPLYQYVTNNYQVIDRIGTFVLLQRRG